MRGVSRVVVVIVALVLWLVPTVARACKCAEAEASLVAAPYLETTTGIVAGRESLLLQCDSLSCYWRSTHAFENTGNTALTTRLLLVSALAREVHVSARGMQIELGPARPLLLDEDEPDPDLPRAAAAIEIEAYAYAEPEVRAGEITIPPHTSVQVEVVAIARPVRWECGCSFWGMRARHLVTTQPNAKRVIAFTHLQKLPPRTEDVGLDISVTTPPREALTIEAGASSLRSRRTRVDAGVTAEDAHKLYVALERDDAGHEAVPRALAGGPFLGVGGGFGDGRGLRLRAGYEMAAPQYLALAAAVESDARRHVEVIPTVELVPPWGRVLSFFPMPGLGFGAPVQVWPDPRVGFRSQLSLGWYFFTIVGSFDLYPAMGGDARMLRGGLVAQFSI